MNTDDNVPSDWNFEPEWLIWARKIASIAQNGLAFSNDQYDIERYSELRKIAAEMHSSYSGCDKEIILNIFSDQKGYATPKIDVRGVVFREGGVLLVKEKSENLWTIPGGWADVNESPGEAIAREVLEESGYEVKPIRLLACYDRARHPHIPPYPFHIYKLFFLCEITGGRPQISNETNDVRFFSLNSLPKLSRSRILHYQIQRLYELAHDPGLPADFD
jgi:ADP-ribose pyrophosphatase YjhB (NUDIX family)